MDQVDRDGDGKFASNDGWLTRHVEKRAKLEQLLSAGPERCFPIPEIRWASRVVQENPFWARDIILKHQ
jgi:hypothetical protein